MDVFSEAIERIKQEYENLGHRLGWWFLYSPASTLSVNTQMFFLGDNPGGKNYEEPIASVEKGNAYRVELWPGGKNGAPNPLQMQVRKLFMILSEKLGHQPPWSDLMDQTLTSNFCPFRSPEWKLLPRQEESLAFSRRLWSSILDYTSPSVIVCNGKNSFKHFTSLMVSKG
jgi:hypothetical protein